MYNPAGASEIDYAATSTMGRKRVQLKLILWGLPFLFSLFTILVQPAWYYEHTSVTTYRLGFFGPSFGFSKLTEQTPLGLLPPPTKYEFAGFEYLNGTMQNQSLRTTGMTITAQWHVTVLIIPMWLPLVTSLCMLVFTWAWPKWRSKGT